MKIIQPEPAILTAAVALLRPFAPDLSPERLQSALKQYDEPAPTKAGLHESERPLTRRQAAEYLGVSLATINRYVKAGKPLGCRRGSSRLAEHVEKLDTGIRRKLRQDSPSARGVHEEHRPVCRARAYADVICVNGDNAFLFAFALYPRIAVLGMMRTERSA